MAKKSFMTPFVLLSGWGGEGSETGGGSGGYSDDPTKLDFYDWMEFYDKGWDDLEEYQQWWMNNNYGSDDWDVLNPDLPNPYGP